MDCLCILPVYKYYTFECFILHMYRVLKEALKASGGNLTEHHRGRIHVCTVTDGGSKKTDREFGCSQSSAHTTTDAESDINKLMVRLMEAEVTQELSNRASPTYRQGARQNVQHLLDPRYDIEVSCDR